MGRKIYVFTNDNDQIIASFTPSSDGETHPHQPRVATDAVIPGQRLHEMEIPEALPEDVSVERLHQELAKMLRGPVE